MGFFEKLFGGDNSDKIDRLRSEYDAKLTELYRGKQALETQFGKDSLAYSQSSATLQSRGVELQRQKGFLEDEQARNLASNARLIQGQDSLAAQQLATIAVQNRQAVGSALQALAMSGLRMTGTASNAVDMARYEADATYGKAMSEAMLDRYTSMAKAVASYRNADNQVQGAQFDIDENATTLENLNASWNLAVQDYNTRHGYYEQDINYMLTTGKKKLEDAIDDLEDAGWATAFGNFMGDVFMIGGGVIGGIIGGPGGAAAGAGAGRAFGQGLGHAVSYTQ